MHDAEDCEAGEGAHVVKAGPRPAAPAVRADDEARVQDEKEEGKPVGDSRGKRCADKAKREGVDEEVVEADV